MSLAPPPPPPPPPLPLPLPVLQPAVPGDPTKEPKYKTPQQILSEFWDEFHTKAPGKVTTIFPRSLYKSLLKSHHISSGSTTRNAAVSYEEAAKACREKVDRIVKECERNNEKFTDPDFDIEYDNTWRLNNCRRGLMTNYPSDPSDENRSESGSGAGGEMYGQRKAAPAATANPIPGKMHNAGEGHRFASDMDIGSVHRVDWVFEDPHFTVDGYSASDIMQGAIGDCWWLAAVATIAHRQDLMDKVMVAQDAKCGVYGFVFHRDGEWIYTVVDDNLYLREPDFTAMGDEYDPTGRKAREYKKTHQTGSKALIFSRCESENETWLPLLEKAYAKVHGDFDAIEGGFSGDGVEDMTGGVNTTLFCNRVLNKDRLWKELVNEKGEFVWSLGLDSTGWEWSRGGMATGHAYSLLKAVEAEGEDGEKVRLVQIRNPWGERDSWGWIGEWNGRWSDGSSEWTPYWMNKLGHKFGNDGVFWMTYEDMLNHYGDLHRTRLFNETWSVAQRWTSVNVSWVTGYLQKKFVIDVKKAGLFVIVLAQLDDRYWQGLEGMYTFELHFLLQKEGAADGDVLCRVKSQAVWELRSISCEIELEPGRYEVLPKVVASKAEEWRNRKPIEDVVQKIAPVNPRKLRQVGMVYDIAHSRCGLMDEDETLEKEKAEKKKKAAEEKAKAKEKEKKEREKEKKNKAKEKARKLKERQKLKEKIEKIKRQNEKKRIARQKRKAEKAKAKEEAKVKEEEEKRKKEEEEAKAKEEAEAKPKEGEEKKGEAAEKFKDDGGIMKEEARPVVEPATEEKAAEEKLTEGKAEGEAPAVGAKAEGDVPPAAPEVPVPAPTVDNADEEDEESESEYEEIPELSDTEEESSDSDSDSDSEDEQPECLVDERASERWNPVAVIGLRVYSQDHDVKVELIEPEDKKEKGDIAKKTAAIETEGVVGS